MELTDNYQPLPIWPQLGEGFSDPVKPAPFPSQDIRYRNPKWSERLGLDRLSDNEWCQFFAQFRQMPKNLETPLALRYHGHQFLHYNPQLGDGRGFLAAQLKDPFDGKIIDLGTKGSGQTPYSRQGDGRLTLKGAVREILATEMLESLGVRTSKTLSVIETGESLQRNDEPSPTRSAVLVRASQSHIRIGTFQRLAHHHEKENMAKLVDYTLHHYFPEAPIEESPALTLHKLCAKGVAQVGAQWMVHGFVHGVLNTDNINITGESFDYGPYRFLPHYDLKFTAAYFDHQGLYAYGRQPQMLLWNLHQLGEALSLLGPIDYKKNDSFFQESFRSSLRQTFLNKLNIVSQGEDQDLELFARAMEFLENSKANYSQFFFDWHGGQLRSASSLYEPKSAAALHQLFAKYEVASAELASSPYYKNDQPEMMLIDEIEFIWNAIALKDDWSPFQQKLRKIWAAPRGSM